MFRIDQVVLARGRTRAAASIVAFGLLLGAFTGAAGAVETPEFPRGSAPFGVSYLRHARHYSRWLFVTPAATNPLADPANCDLRDVGSLRFLPPPTGAGQSNTCTVDSSVGLVVVPAGAIAWPDPGEPYDAQAILAEARANFADLKQFVVTVDGVAVRHLRRDFEFRSVVGTNVPDDNLFDLPAGYRPLAFDTIAVVLRPLSPGHHEIVTSVTYRSDGSTLDLTTDLNVVA